MNKHLYHYAIYGYRYAPENFHMKKGLPGRPLQEVSLSDDQRAQVGYLYITQGHKAAVDQVKRIERERAQKPNLYITYGFRSQDGGYVYCPQLRCQPEAPVAERMAMFRSAREAIERCGCKVLQHESCELDGNYRPINVKRHYAVVDLMRPLTVWIKLI